MLNAKAILEKARCTDRISRGPKHLDGCYNIWLEKRGDLLAAWLVGTMSTSQGYWLSILNTWQCTGLHMADAT